MINITPIIIANNINKNEYINAHTDAYLDELSKKVNRLFGCKVSTFLFKYVPLLAKAIVLILERAAKKDYKAELQQNRCAQLDPSLPNNISREIETAYKSLSEDEKKDAVENVFKRITSKSHNLFRSYFNPKKHKYLIHNSIEDYLKFAPMRELVKDIQERHKLTPKQIYYHVSQIMKRHEGIEQKEKKEIVAMQLQSLNELYEMNFSSDEKKDIRNFREVIESISVEKANEYISIECSKVDDVTSYLTKTDTIQRNDGASLYVPHALKRDAIGGLPSFTIFQRSSEGSLICADKRPALKGTYDDSITMAHIEPIINLIDETSKANNISSDNKNELTKRVLLTLTQAYANPIVNVLQQAALTAEDTSFLPAALNGYQPRILIYDQEKKTLTIDIDIRAGFTDYAEKINQANGCPAASPHLVGQIIAKLTISLNQNDINSAWKTLEISPLILPKDKPKIAPAILAHHKYL